MNVLILDDYRLTKGREMVAKKRMYNKTGKCVKCGNLIEPICQNCNSTKLIRLIDWDIKVEWFQCKKCSIESHWILCKNCGTQNPISIFGHNLGFISMVWKLLLIVAISAIFLEKYFLLGYIVLIVLGYLIINKFLLSKLGTETNIVIFVIALITLSWWYNDTKVSNNNDRTYLQQKKQEQEKLEDSMIVKLSMDEFRKFVENKKEMLYNEATRKRLIKALTNEREYLKSKNKLLKKIYTDLKKDNQTLETKAKIDVIIKQGIAIKSRVKEIEGMEQYLLNTFSK